MNPDTGYSLQTDQEKMIPFMITFIIFNKGGAAHVLHEFRENVTEFNPHSIAPRTPYLEQMSVSGEHPLTKLMRDMYKEEVFPFTTDRHVIGSLELHDWLRDQKIGQARINEVKNALENIGARDLGQVGCS